MFLQLQSFFVNEFCDVFIEASKAILTNEKVTRKIFLQIIQFFWKSSMEQKIVFGKTLSIVLDAWLRLVNEIKCFVD